MDRLRRIRRLVHDRHLHTSRVAGDVKLVYLNEHADADEVARTGLSRSADANVSKMLSLGVNGLRNRGGLRVRNRQTISESDRGRTGRGKAAHPCEGFGDHARCLLLGHLSSSDDRATEQRQQTQREPRMAQRTHLATPRLSSGRGRLPAREGQDPDILISPTCDQGELS